MNLRNHLGSALIFLLAAGAAVAGAAPDLERRTTLALTYREGQGTQVDMVGVNAPMRGRADVKRTEGRTRVKLRMEPLPHPQSLGPQYTTYVLWAVAPEGRAESLAELPSGKEFDVDATTSLPTFGLIVTAEPHALVTRPGPRLVAENGLNEDTRGRVQAGSVEYDAAPERQIVDVLQPDFTTPLLVLGARRAVEIAKLAGADTYAEPELREAEVKLAVLDHLWAGKHKLNKDAETTARDVMRLAEHARTVTAERMAQAQRATERREARTAVQEAEIEAAAARAATEQERQRAARARQETALAEQQVAQAREQIAQVQAEATQAQAEATQARAAEEMARAQADRARLEAEKAQQDKAQMQEQLFQSLSSILETRREARGLIVNLSDVLFDFNKASLTPGAREKLSKLAGVLLAYPGPYHMEIEGHTDAVGSDAYNLGLSQGRADSVSSYLRQAGIPADRITRVTGFGESRPVAGNETAAGRQMNRRVELVITDLDLQP
jgi:outer membrane protein OmpA-like peptidoglycan-associated protein